MSKDENTKSTPSVWKWQNTANITKIGIQGTVALASLAGAVTAILVTAKVIAGPASLALVAGPAGIAVLFIAAVYFAAQAYSSYQQMNAIGEKGEAFDLSSELKKTEIMGIFDNRFQGKTN